MNYPPGMSDWFDPQAETNRLKVLLSLGYEILPNGMLVPPPPKGADEVQWRKFREAVAKIK